MEDYQCPFSRVARLGTRLKGGGGFLIGHELATPTNQRFAYE